MSKQKIFTRYVSPMDQFINQFDNEHPALSKAQLKEKEKYARIYYLRDVANRPDEDKKLEDF